MEVKSSPRAATGPDFSRPAIRWSAHVAAEVGHRGAELGWMPALTLAMLDDSCAG
jgi:hypothetical protein